jgi:hypothetical protein
MTSTTTGELRAAASLPQQDTELYQPRYLSDSGSRLYFDAYEPLLPRDTDGTMDVYEWEAAGAGSCDESSSSFSPPDGGCLYLISSGQSPHDSEFLDASPEGRDVFFSTLSSLVPEDPNLVDVYDAREGGGFPAPPSPAAPCEGEACQGTSEAPNAPTPASASFEGAGNVREGSSTGGRTCSKGKVRKHGRCVKVQHKKNRHGKHKRHGRDHGKHKRHGRDGRAGR